MCDQNVNDFLKEVLTNPEACESMELTQRDAEVLAEALNSPPVINENLLRAIQRYKEYIGEDNG